MILTIRMRHFDSKVFVSNIHVERTQRNNLFVLNKKCAGVQRHDCITLILHMHTNETS